MQTVQVPHPLAHYSSPKTVLTTRESIIKGAKIYSNCRKKTSLQKPRYQIAGSSASMMQIHCFNLVNPSIYFTLQPANHLNSNPVMLSVSPLLQPHSPPQISTESLFNFLPQSSFFFFPQYFTRSKHITKSYSCGQQVTTPGHKVNSFSNLFLFPV